MKVLIKLSFSFLTVFSILILSVVFYYNSILPNNIVIYENENVKFNTKLKITERYPDYVNSVSKNLKNSENYDTELSVMGFIPIKNININKVKERYVALSGESFGIKIFTKGVMVVGMSDVSTNTGNINPSKTAGLKIGDIILSVDKKSINSNMELSNIINNSDGKNLCLKVKREEKIINIDFKAVKSAETGEYKAGLWVRDSTAGLGTMTFYSTVNGAFAGLGHGIVDVDTGIMLPVKSGEIVKTEILSVTKSQKGAAGEICGAFTGETKGKLIRNSECGLYGILNNFDKPKKLIKIAHKQDVKTGSAKIYTSLDNSGPKYYNCVIERVDYNNKSQKNLLIRITDEKLIEKTGGIVQGMSGSPIVQNGQLVGALTNVFLNDPEKGYAVFSEEMYDELIDSTSSINRAS